MQMDAGTLLALLGLIGALISIIRTRQESKATIETAKEKANIDAKNAAIALEKIKLEHKNELERQEAENDRQRELDTIKQRSILQEQVRNRDLRVSALERDTTIHLENRAAAGSLFHKKLQEDKETEEE